MSPLTAFFLGSAFMLREIELAYARLGHLCVDPVRRRAVLELPVGKTDPTAVGCTRTWGCICQPPAVRQECVFHMALEYQRKVQEMLEVEPGDPLTVSVPLFPDRAGKTVTKAAVSAMVEGLAELTGETLQDGLGQRRFSGHSLRVSGAQWLGHLGFGVEQVQTFGRWSSDVVVRYLGESHVSDMARTHRQQLRERALLEGQALVTASRSGPQLETTDEVQKIVKDALAGPLAKVTGELDALRARTPASAELVLHERYKRVHRLACSLAEPSDHWVTQCGWRFVTARKWRLSAPPAPGYPWKGCPKCGVVAGGQGAG